jgi:uncharacterized membrane protein YagU involved in acid resistance
VIAPPLKMQLAAGAAAGLTGAILLDAFLFVTQIVAGAPPGQVISGAFTFIASVLFGPGIAANPAAPAIGAVIHLCVSIGWALGYVYLVRTQPQLLVRPWISGAGFGLVVYVFMLIVLLTAGMYHRPSPQRLENELIAHMLFFGIPVALVVSRVLARPAAA